MSIHVAKKESSSFVTDEDPRGRNVLLELSFLIIFVTSHYALRQLHS